MPVDDVPGKSDAHNVPYDGPNLNEAGTVAPVVAPAEAERDRLERDALTQLVRDLSGSASSTRAVLARLADAARRIVLADGTCVLEILGDEYRVVAPSGSTVQFDNQRFDMKPPPSLFREAIVTRQPVFTNNGATDPRVDARFRQPLNIRQAAVAPIIVGGAVTGMLVCINSGRGGYTHDDMAALQRLADHTALVLFSARLVRQAEEAASDARERAADAAREGRHLAVLARTAQVLASALTREALYGGLARICEEDLGAHGCSIYDVHPETRTARLEFQSGIARVDRALAAENFWDTRLRQVLESGEPEFVGDIDKSSNKSERELNEPLRQSGIGSIAVLPLSYGDRARGLIAIRFTGQRVFDDDERKLLSNFGTQVAVALRHVGYFSDLEVRAQRLTALAQAQQHLTRIVSRDALLPAIAEAVTSVVPAAMCDLFFTAPGGLQRVFVSREGQRTSIGELEAPRLEFVRATFETGVPRIGVSIADDDATMSCPVELCAPVRFGERSIGVLRLSASPHGSFDLQDLDLVTILARHAGSTLETARLFGSQDLERQRAEAAADIARVVLHAGPFLDGAIMLLQVLDRVVPTAGKAIGIARARDGHIEYVAVSGTLQSLLGHRPAGAHGVKGVAPDGRPFEISNLHELAPDQMRDRVPNDWTFVVPLVARDRTIGVMLATMPAGTRLDQTARTTLERLSASLALAFDALLLDEEERQARERERMLATALTTMDHPVFILDLASIRYANPAALREYGWSLMELTGMTIDEIEVEQSSRTRAATNNVFLERGPSLTEHTHRRRDGSEFPAAVTQNAIAAEDGSVVGQVISVRNMTAEREFADQMRHAEKMVALGELVARVAHEINNPLTGISAFAQLLLEESLAPEQRESVQLIKRESDRAKGVISDLLLFARKEGSAAGPVDVNAVLEQTLRLRAYSLRSAGVEVSVVLDPSLPCVLGDGQKLQQVFLNVIVNAEHAMEGGTGCRLSLRTRLEDNRVIVEATDTGRGMSADVRRRIFEPFYTTKPAGIGTGLGLSVSYGIVQAHQGTIEVLSEPGVGTTISIVLPAATHSGLFASTAGSTSS